MYQKSVNSQKKKKNFMIHSVISECKGGVCTFKIQQKMGNKLNCSLLIADEIICGLICNTGPKN